MKIDYWKYNKIDFVPMIDDKPLDFYKFVEDNNITSEKFNEITDQRGISCLRFKSCANPYIPYHTLICWTRIDIDKLVEVITEISIMGKLHG